MGLIPNIDVLTTNDVFDHTGHITGPLLDHVFNSGISDGTLTDSINNSMSDLVQGSNMEDFMHDIFPLLPFVIITISEGRKVFMGKKTFEMALVSGFERSVKSGAAIAAGAIFT